jgi:hypothetical protein
MARKRTSSITRKKISQALRKRPYLSQSLLGAGLGLAGGLTRRKLMGEKLGSKEAFKEYSIEAGIGAGSNVVGQYLERRFRL